MASPKSPRRPICRRDRTAKRRSGSRSLPSKRPRSRKPICRRISRQEPKIPDRVVTENDSKKPSRGRSQDGGGRNPGCRGIRRSRSERRGRRSTRTRARPRRRSRRMQGIGKDIRKITAEWEKQDQRASRRPHKRYPEGKSPKTTKVKVSFVLNRRGNVLSVDVVEVSGDPALRCGRALHGPPVRSRAAAAGRADATTGSSSAAVIIFNGQPDAKEQEEGRSAPVEPDRRHRPRPGRRRSAPPGAGALGSADSLPEASAVFGFGAGRRKAVTLSAAGSAARVRDVGRRSRRRPSPHSRPCRSSRWWPRSPRPPSSAPAGPCSSRGSPGLRRQRGRPVELGHHLPGGEIGAGLGVGASRNQHVGSFDQVGL